MAKGFKERREELNISQDEAASRLQLAGFDTTRATISHWETGRNPIPLDSLKARKALAAALEMKISDIDAIAGTEILNDQSEYSQAAKHAAILIDRMSPNAQRVALEVLRTLERSLG